MRGFLSVRLDWTLAHSCGEVAPGRIRDAIIAELMAEFHESQAGEELLIDADVGVGGGMDNEEFGRDAGYLLSEFIVAYETWSLLAVEDVDDGALVLAGDVDEFSGISTNQPDVIAVVRDGSIDAGNRHVTVDLLDKASNSPACIAQHQYTIGLEWWHHMNPRSESEMRLRRID